MNKEMEIAIAEGEAARVRRQKQFDIMQSALSDNMAALSEKVTPSTNRGVTSVISEGNGISDSNKIPYVQPYSSVDYYTATSKLDGVGLHWLKLFQVHKNMSMDNGWKPSSSKRYGYDVQYINGLSYGYKERQGFLMTASSEVANKTFTTVCPTASRITRFDMAYTFQMLGAGDLVMRKYLEALKGEKAKGKRGIIHKSDGGGTLYVGSRQSDQFGRFYNKSIEGKLSDPDIFRLEVEYKKPRSSLVFDTVYSDLVNGRCNADAMRSRVIEWFSSRGLDLGLKAVGTVQPIRVELVANDDKRRLKWLKTAVAPTLYDLSGRGKFEELSKALNLSKRDYEQLAMFAPDRGEA